MDPTIEFLAASTEFYAPLASVPPGDDDLAPVPVPVDWSSATTDVWRTWRRPARAYQVEDGWKVHVSARAERVQEVLDAVAGTCFAHDVPFKHLATRRFFWWANQKYAHRAQSGKFIAAYPTDADAALRLMERLRDALSGEDGPSILSDRRFRDSRTVHYRYGAFVSRARIRADGTRSLLVRDGHGRLVADRRGVGFHLPKGITDPFALVDAAGGDAATRSPDGIGGARFGGFAVESPVRFTNAGGTYRGRQLATGRPVFLKEARAHTGLRDDHATAQRQLREEWATLTELHALVPGLAPEPIEYFQVWRHEFMAVEHVEGIPLSSWLATHHPLLRAGSTVADFAAFYTRCEKIAAGVDDALSRLHAAGYLFVDNSPGNMLVAADDSVRLVDFGAAHRLGGIFLAAGTPGYSPPKRIVGSDLSVYDDYGLAALTQHLFGPLQLVLELNPDAAAHLHHDLSELAPVPPHLWMQATRFFVPSGPTALPSPEAVAVDPLRHLADLRDRVADAVLAMAETAHPARVFPTIPAGYLTNTSCVAYGTAGVVHALRRAGRPLPEGLLDRLRTDALGSVTELPPGLFAGLAGIARVLADAGLLQEAGDLLAAADRHPLTGESATLFGGVAGIALTHLAMYGYTGEQWHVDRAVALAGTLPPGDRLAEWLGPDDAVGLMHGRSGVALFLHQLAGVTGAVPYQDRALRLLHAELDRAVDPEAGTGLYFPVSAADNRIMPYLYAGTAGVAFAAVRCARATGDERLAAAMPGLLAPLRLPYTAMPGLCQGLAGTTFTLAEHSRLTGDPAARADAVRSARYLFKYAVPHPTGVRFLGDQLLRYSAELWSGSAGVLLALSHVLDARPDALLTVDSLIGARP
jgi:Lanthionine synthetase C-like protein